ncbi:MAG: tRNA pseudouridine(55) synthase TruB [Gemmatimonadota bacterium]|nr:tRNA pseudouridine(55) synthase TruB [Gemmatimonadota bacterium]
MTPTGLLLIDKPEGPSSHDVIAVVRRELGLRRAGHTGTLDPFASGLLLVCVGWATRLVEYFHVLPKVYEAAILLGERRDTDDRTGVVVARSDAWRSIDRDRFASALAEFDGVSEQRPPDYSARKVGGLRAYRAARAGAPLQLEPRTIAVSDMCLLSWDPPRARIALTVSTGTYIRAIARDLGERLACHAHLEALRRIRIGTFDVCDASSGADLAEAAAGIVTPLDAVSWLQRRELDPEELASVLVGRPIRVGAPSQPPRPVATLDTASLPTALHADGQLVAIGMADGEWLKPSKVFHAA